ncbi:hypothetical protein [Bradyrhizobium vignae]|uniref:Uncharacterized protein n=1 Tax=Bradyrhizobium vignae TaxID=1549949 RepID=A0A2U3PUR0_9BRAD|nr:hypothetical protein [Bradyrhizobium vignae]SPP92897.1 protein of unknown function [Bradyrhizobium vignae]
MLKALIADIINDDIVCAAHANGLRMPVRLRRADRDALLVARILRGALWLSIRREVESIDEDAARSRAYKRMQRRASTRP